MNWIKINKTTVKGDIAYIIKKKHQVFLVVSFIKPHTFKGEFLSPLKYCWVQLKECPPCSCLPFAYHKYIISGPRRVDLNDTLRCNPQHYEIFFGHLMSSLPSSCKPLLFVSPHGKKRYLDRLLSLITKGNTDLRWLTMGKFNQTYCIYMVLLFTI